MKNFFNRNKKSAAPAAYTPPRKPIAPIADPYYNPYKYMTEDEARSAAFKAVMADDVKELMGIAQYYTTCAQMMIYPNGSIGSERMRVPLIHYAAGEGNLQALRWLIDNGADLEARSNLLNQTTLYFAVQRGQVAAAEMLLKAGADPFTRAEVPKPIDLMHVATADGVPPEMAALIRRYQGLPAAEDPASMAVREARVIKALPVVVGRKRD